MPRWKEFLAARIGRLSEDSTLVPENRPSKCSASNEGSIKMVQISFFPGVVIGVIIGYFVCSWLVIGKIG